MSKFNFLLAKVFELRKAMAAGLLEIALVLGYNNNLSSLTYNNSLSSPTHNNIPTSSLMQELAWTCTWLISENVKKNTHLM